MSLRKDEIRNKPFYRLSRRGYLWLRNALCRNSIHPSPVFVLGNQKSGTSAIAGLLAKASGNEITMDIRGIYEPALGRLHAGKLDFDRWVRNNRWELANPIIKEPMLTFLYPHLKKCFPGSSMVFVIRDPRDNIRSILDRLNLSGDRERVPDEKMAALSPEWRSILCGTYQRAHASHYVEQLAIRWTEAAEVYLQSKNDFTLVRYEDFLEDKESELLRVAPKTGLSFRHDVKHLLNYPFQPPGTGQSPETFFGKRNLSRIEEVCFDYTKIFEYPQYTRKL